MALRTRSRSTCRRTTSSGSVTVIATASHVSGLVVQAVSGMWTERGVTSLGIPSATCASWPLFPARASALANPAERRLGLRHRRRLMLAVAPGAAGALLMVPLPAGNADHSLYCAAQLGASVLIRDRTGLAARPRTWQERPRGYTRPLCSQISSSGRGAWVPGATRVSRTLRRRWRGASDDGARPSAHPRSGHPRCRTFLAAIPRSSGIQAAPGKQRRHPWPCAP